MEFNISFEICSLSFLCILIIFYKKKGKNLYLTDKVYEIFLFFALFDIAINLISVVTIAHAVWVPLWLNYVINTLYFVLQSFLPAILTLYIALMIRKIETCHIIMLSIPACISCVLALSGPITRFYFYFNQNLEYVKGFGQFFLYINGIYCGCIALYLSIKYRKKLGSVLFYTAISITFINVCGLLLQYLLPKHFVTGTSVVLSLLIIYLSLQNPDIYIDSLTRTLNRHTFVVKLDEIQERKKKLPLLIVSLNNFKLINQIFGVMNGDYILKLVAGYLMELTNDQSVYRISGDIFVITLLSEQEAENLCQKVLLRFTQPWKLQETMQASVSACLCRYDIHCGKETDEEIMKTIDSAVLEAKKHAKGQIYHVKPNALQVFYRKAAIEEALSACIRNRSFEVHYQPIYSTKEKRYTTLEALARLCVPEVGYVSPDEFILIAEQNGMVIPVGLLVVEEVCRFINRANLPVYGFESVEINVSVIQCMQEDFAQEIFDILKRNTIPPSYINFELTETAAVLSEEMLIQNMKKLMEAGVGFSMDDYGSGYSTINYLTALPFSVIKLDKTMVWSYFKNQEARIIMGKTVEMLKMLNFRIVAEGVETSEQAKTLAAMGIDFLQGYFYSAPVPEPAFITILKK